MKSLALAVAVVGSLLVGCGSGTASVDVVGTWTLTTVVLPDGSTVSIPARDYAWFGVGSAGDGSGRDGTNNFTLHYTQTGTTLRFTDVAISTVGLAEPAPTALRAAAAGMGAMLSGHDVSASLAETTLVLTTTSSSGTYVLTFAPRNGAVG